MRDKYQYERGRRNAKAFLETSPSREQVQENYGNTTHLGADDYDVGYRHVLEEHMRRER